MAVALAEARATSRTAYGVSSNVPVRASRTRARYSGVIEPWIVSGAHTIGVMSNEITVRAIGFIRCGYTETSQIPKGRRAIHTAEGTIEIASELEEGLTDIDGFSHLFVIWAFDRAAEGYDLLTTPPGESRARGLFATRSPR